MSAPLRSNRGATNSMLFFAFNLLQSKLVVGVEVFVQAQ